MKNHFIKLFNYDQAANTMLINLILKEGDNDKAIRTMAHLLASQQVWITRCKKLPAIGGALWPDWQPDTFINIVNENHHNWIGFLENLQPGNLDMKITYQNSKGDTFENTLLDILTHLINHGTHHRAQIGQYLKQEGESLPLTDYIFYVRTLDKTGV